MGATSLLLPFCHLPTFNDGKYYKKARKEANGAIVFLFREGQQRSVDFVLIEGDCKHGDLH